jgi:hypothetical protein
LLLLLLFVHLVAESLAGRSKWKGVLFLGLSLIIIRLIIYSFPELLNLGFHQLLRNLVPDDNFIKCFKLVFCRVYHQHC